MPHILCPTGYKTLAYHAFFRVNRKYGTTTVVTSCEGNVTVIEREKRSFKIKYIALPATLPSGLNDIRWP